MLNLECQITNELVGRERQCATPAQEIPSHAVGLFDPILDDLTNLLEGNVQVVGSASCDLDNLASVGNELLDGFANLEQQEHNSDQRGCLENQQDRDGTYHEHLQ